MKVRSGFGLFVMKQEWQRVKQIETRKNCTKRSVSAFGNVLSVNKFWYLVYVFILVALLLI